MNQGRRSRSVPIGLLTAALGMSASATAQAGFAWHWDMHLDALQSDTPLELNDFAPADVDRDGDVDLLVAGHGGGWLWYNDGDGVFSRRVALAGLYDHTRCAAWADVDGDGDLDAFLAGGRSTYGASGSCVLARNDGAGQMVVSPTIPPYPASHLHVQSLAAADLDADGDVDLVLFPADRSPLCWRNDGTGTFTEVTAQVLPPSPWPGGRGRVADVDGDGAPDILATDGRRLLRNGGNGVFTEVAGFQQTFLEVADLDGDGDPDLIDATVIRRNDGNLVFTAVGSLPAVFPAVWGIERIHAADLDGDGRCELIGTDGVGGPCILRDTGGFVFADVSATWIGPEALVDRTAGYAFGGSALLDVDGDGDLDLLTGGSEGRMGSSTTVGIPPKLLLQREPGRFVYANQPAFPWVQQQVAGFAAGDVDGDGQPELLVCGLGYGNSAPGVQVWQQDAAGRFTERPTGLQGWILSALVLVDVDGDRDLDLFGVSGAGPHGYTSPVQHRLARNDGRGVFTEVTTTHLPVLASAGASGAAGDVDGDGDLDLVVGSFDLQNAQGAPLWLLVNDGTGHFTAASAQLPASPVEAAELALRDFDADGDLDLAIAIGSPLGVPPATRYYRNAGNGTFTDVSATHVPAGATGSGVFACDLDGDGDLDLAQDGGSLRNDGTGRFTAAPGPAGRLLAADLDGDGTIDDVVDGNGWLLVDGQQFGFGFQVAGHRALAVDLDRDGDLDLAVGCLLGMFSSQWAAAHVGVLWNQRRDLRANSQPRLGQPWRLRVQADPGGRATLAIVAVAPGLLASRRSLAGLGDLALDPAHLGVLGHAVLAGAAASAELVLPIPRTNALVDMPAAAQALFVPVGDVAAARLSNAFALPILP